MKLLPPFLFALVLLLPGRLHAQPGPATNGTAPDGLKALQHPEAAVRLRALATLARLGPDAKFAGPEVRAVLKDANGLVRVQAAETLWKIEHPPASVVLPVLVISLQDNDAAVRARVSAVLAQLGRKAKPAIPALVQALRDKDLGVQMEAIVALGDLGSTAQEAAPALLDLTRSKDFDLLEALLGSALANLGRETTPLLLEALRDRAPERRRLAAYALAGGDFGSDAVNTALAAALGDAEPSIRVQAARALGKHGPSAQAAVPRLQALLKEEPAVRVQAALSLYQIEGQARHLDVLRRALREEDGGREQASQALAEMGTAAEPALPELASTLRDKNPLVQINLLAVLGNLGPAGRPLLPNVRTLLKDEDFLIRIPAAVAMWKMSGEAAETLKLLETALDDEDPKTQRLTLAALGEMKTAARPLVPTLSQRYREEERPALSDALAAALRQIDPATAARLGIRAKEPAWPK